MNNPNQKSYWQGYRDAKSMNYDCGMSSVESAYLYGLNGKSDAYCRGWKRYIDFVRNKKNKHN